MKFIAIVIIVIRIPQRSEKGQTHAQWAKNGKNSAIKSLNCCCMSEWAGLGTSKDETFPKV